MISVKKYSKKCTPSIQSSFAVLLLITMLLVVSGCSTTAPNSSVNSSTSTSEEIANNNKPTEQQELTYKTALLALDSKDFETAETLLLELKTSNPSLSGPWANLGLIRLIQKQPVEAEAYLLKALQLNPRLAKAQNLMGLIATHNMQLG
ncbi:MAG: hypothetical protein OQK04_09285, partial [Kangiellaceae bacterium]|nr:hypothetical protein [Kangiellaceae bacterium]